MGKKKVLFWMIIFLIFVFAGNFKFQSNTESTSYDVLVVVGNNASFNSKGNKLFFEIPAGKILQGSVKIQNPRMKRMKMQVFVSGQLKDFKIVEIMEPNFELSPKEIKDVHIKISAPLRKGEYKGKILVEGKRV